MHNNFRRIQVALLLGGFTIITFGTIAGSSLLADSELISQFSFASDSEGTINNQTTTVLKPLEDVLVKDKGDNETRNKNYNSGTQGGHLRTKYDQGDEYYESLIKFDYSSVSTTIYKATLRLYAYNSSKAQLILAKVDNNWNENVVTWATKPPVLQDNIGSWNNRTQNNTWIEFDVTNALYAHNSSTISFLIRNAPNDDGDDSYYFRSSEANPQPELVLQSSPLSQLSPTPIVVDPSEAPEITQVQPTQSPRPTVTPRILPSPPTATPVPNNTPTPVPTIFIPPTTNGSGVWISQDEIRNLPMSGTAWNKVVSEANSNWGQPCLYDNNCENDVKTYAGALYATRTGDSAMRSKVISSLNAAVPSTTSRALELCRGLQTYIIAADVIGYHSSGFEAGLRELLYRKLSGHSGGDSAVKTAELSPNNWGKHCTATVAAAGIYLNDSFLKQIAVDAQKDFVGISHAKLNYTSTSWHANTLNKAGINRVGAVINGINVSGVAPEDWRRGGDFKWPPSPSGYMWEAEQGNVVTAVILHRAGLLSFNAGDNAVVRSIHMLYGTGEASQNSPRFVNPASGDDTWIPWVVNYYGGTNFPTTPASSGKNMCCTDWTHAR